MPRDLERLDIDKLIVHGILSEQMGVNGRTAGTWLGVLGSGAQSTQR